MLDLKKITELFYPHLLKHGMKMSKDQLYDIINNVPEDMFFTDFMKIIKQYKTVHPTQRNFVFDDLDVAVNWIPEGWLVRASMHITSRQETNVAMDIVPDKDHRWDPDDNYFSEVDGFGGGANDMCFKTPEGWLLLHLSEATGIGDDLIHVSHIACKHIHDPRHDIIMKGKLLHQSK